MPAYPCTCPQHATVLRHLGSWNQYIHAAVRAGTRAALSVSVTPLVPRPCTIKSIRCPNRMLSHSPSISQCERVSVGWAGGQGMCSRPINAVFSALMSIPRSSIQLRGVLLLLDLSRCTSSDSDSFPRVPDSPTARKYSTSAIFQRLGMTLVLSYTARWRVCLIFRCTFTTCLP